jgi:hypothetical protein
MPRGQIDHRFLAFAFAFAFATICIGKGGTQGATRKATNGQRPTF